MIRHISLFRMMRKPENGKTMEENIQAVKAYLEKLPEMNEAIVGNQVGVSAGGPDFGMDGPAFFTDVAQVIDFADPKAAMEYPMSQAHVSLVEFTKGMVEKVVAIDYEF